MSNQPKESRAKARERLTAERAAQAAAAKRRERLMRLGLVAVVVVVVAGIAVGVVLSRKSSSDTSGAVPPGVTATKGYPLGTATKPVVDVWEDFQCPNCAAFEKAGGAQIQALATAGKALVVYHTWSFLDRLNASNPEETQQSSTRAAIAAACAADQGKFLPMHGAIFANQPATEGTGYTDAQLEAFAKTAGVSDAGAFQQCLSSRKYAGFVNSVGTQADSQQLTGTPTVLVDGKIVDFTGVSGWAEATQRVLDAVSKAS